MNINEQIEILEAHRDGKRVEYRCRDGGWSSCRIGRAFNFINYEYRIVKTGKERLVGDVASIVGNTKHYELMYRTIIKDVIDGKYGELKEVDDGH